ncbi:hypothetical protein COCCU_05780 [Corynebacterium occultum]|uniref:ATP/GTP-binding protein n=1 Tax=Corynebacterium occultum TaxID=2675219 RepID=A0A6B8WAS7_9CORY|nr:hypothetical protein [Corynebacterium occultum]QGU07100.1 hypothetical protein COCCU_05780 [Corynebacterium occultum]
MARKNRRDRSAAPHPLPMDGSVYFGTREQEGPSWTMGEIYLVRQMGSSAAKKFYVCPGCNQNIPPGVAHVVAWPKEIGRGPDDRRHWHKPCWERR